ncbi:zinc-binding protein [Maribellus comscasis]|uniref:Zinc-binding protein n=1 Tax=Maribellus comscasis TaxID=2681766 RepID=A0A6I6JQH4_9BACT|nr:putative zinc-binding protein [Maribellus comscasis]QGY42377.1 zinc-binding protein [Maribellus comscasis]
MEKKLSCSCGSAENCTVFACSGAADLGQASDLLARKLHKNEVRQMKCLAFVSAGITEMIDSVKDSNMLVIDGCNLDCGKKTFEKNGLNDFIHLRLTDLGFEKGKTPPTEDVIEKMYEEAIFMV